MVMGISISGEMTAGEAAVAAGTLLLAIFTLVLAFFTWRLARRAREEAEQTERSLTQTERGLGYTERSLTFARQSIEAQSAPFVVATPKWNGKPPWTRGVDDGKWHLMVELENWGKGPAIIDGASVLDVKDHELVTTDFQVENPVLPNVPWQTGFVLGNLTEPYPGLELSVNVSYRSMSGARYVTRHRLAVEPENMVTRLDFRRVELSPAPEPDYG